MVDILMIGWYVGLISAIIITIELVLFVRGIKNITSDHSTKTALTYMAITVISVIIEMLIICFNGIFNLGFDSKLWFLFSFLYVITAGSWFFGTYGLLKIVRGFEEK